MKRRFLKLIYADDDNTFYVDPAQIIAIEDSDTPLNCWIRTNWSGTIEVKHTSERLLELIECTVDIP